MRVKNTTSCFCDDYTKLPISFQEIWSHPHTPLICHLYFTGKRMVRVFDETVLQSFSLYLTQNNAVHINNDLLRAIAYLIGCTHDIAKTTRFFQEYLRGQQGRSEKTKHAYLSSLFTFFLIKKYVTYYYILSQQQETTENQNPVDKELVGDLLALIGFVTVKHHHSDLKDVYDELSSLKAFKSPKATLIQEQLENVNENVFNELINKLLSVGQGENYLLSNPERKFQFLYQEFLTFYKETISKTYTRLRRTFKQMGKLIESEYQNLSGNNWENTPTKVIEITMFPLLLQFYYSLLQFTDKSSAMELPELQRIRELSLVSTLESFRQKKFSGNVHSNIDHYREEIFQHTKKIAETIDPTKQKIFALNVPTGFGKTLTSLGFAFALRERLQTTVGITPRIIYALPFLSIIEQNYHVVKEVLASSPMFSTENPIPTNVLLKHHHLSELDYQVHNGHQFQPNESEFLIESWAAEIIVTTFYQLLYSYLTPKKNKLRKFHALWNAIVILDEVQAIDTHYWDVIRFTFTALARFSNTYFVLTTATMPLIFSPNQYTKIIPPEQEEKYYRSIDRVTLDVDLNELPFSKFLEWLHHFLTETHPQKNVMIVLNTVKSAKKVLHYLKQNLKNETTCQSLLYHLSTYITPSERLSRLNDINEKITETTTRTTPSNNTSSHDPTCTRIILVTTQLVEAGVDIDFDIVIRDFGPLDSIFQAAGRCNRNFRFGREKSQEKGLVLIKKLYDDSMDSPRPFSSMIYPIILLEATSEALNTYADPQRNQIIQINEHDFYDLMQKYYRIIRQKVSQETATENLLIYGLSNLNFEKLKDFILIKEDPSRVEVFVQLNQEAQQIWEQYQEILQIKDINERKNRYNAIKSAFYNYIISVRKDFATNLPTTGNLRYIDYEQLPYYYDSTEQHGTGFLREDVEEENPTLFL